MYQLLNDGFSLSSRPGASVLTRSKWHVGKKAGSSDFPELIHCYTLASIPRTVPRLLNRV